MRSDFKVFVGLKDAAYTKNIKELLGNFYTVAASSEGNAIINHLLEKQPDLAILDCDISEIDVLKMCEKLSCDYPSINTVIYVTLEKLYMAKRKWRKRALDYIVGPLDEEEFVEDVNKVVRYILMVRNREKLIRNKIELRYQLNMRLLNIREITQQALDEKDWELVKSLAQEIAALEKTIKDIDALSS